MLVFEVARERVELRLGAGAARRWAAAIARPAPSLPNKLGTTAATRVSVTGAVDDAALREPLANCAAPDGAVDLAVVRADDLAALAQWFCALAGAAVVPPVWVISPKGRTSSLTEGAVRAFMRDRDFTDTKVTSVSERLAALRFNQRRP